MNIKEKLTHIQTNIKVPKDLTNKFGGYNYRNAEGIFEAVKPYLDETKTTLIIKDDIAEVGGRVYVKATAMLIDNESDSECIEVCAFARESEVKKGMDESQITGAASSYARKYAMNGLFLLDDTKDADSEDYKKTNDRKAKVEDEVNAKLEKAEKQVAKYTDESLVDPATVVKIKDALKKAGKSEKGCLDYYEVKDFSELKVNQATVLLKSLGVN